MGFKFLYFYISSLGLTNKSTIKNYRSLEPNCWCLCNLVTSHIVGLLVRHRFPCPLDIWVFALDDNLSKSCYGLNLVTDVYPSCLLAMLLGSIRLKKRVKDNVIIATG